MADDVQFRFGKNARIELAPYTDGTEPAAGDYINFCLTNQVEVGLSNGTITIDESKRIAWFVSNDSTSGCQESVSIQSFTASRGGKANKKKPRTFQR